MPPIAHEPDEATPLDPDDMAGLKFPHIATRGELDRLEQANVTAGVRWLERTRRADALDDLFLCELHRRLFGDVWSWAGEYRKSGKNIGIDWPDIPVAVRQFLGDARYWAEQGVYDPLEAGARYHHRLVQIHAFPNGNGRHARIAADVYLKQCFGQPPIDWAGGEDLQADGARRRAYIDALRAADREDFAPLLAFVGVE